MPKAAAKKKGVGRPPGKQKEAKTEVLDGGSQGQGGSQVTREKDASICSDLDMESIFHLHNLTTRFVILLHSFYFYSLFSL